MGVPVSTEIPNERSCPQRLFRMWKSDFECDANPRATDMAEVIGQFSGKFDENSERGFALGLENPRIFDSHWYDRESRARFLPRYVEPDYGVDLESFVAVRRSCEPIELVGSPIPAVAFFGRHERVVCKETEIRLLREAYADLTVHELPNSAHFPHVEETEAFLGILGDAMSGVSKRSFR